MDQAEQEQAAKLAEGAEDDSGNAVASAKQQRTEGKAQRKSEAPEPWAYLRFFYLPALALLELVLWSCVASAYTSIFIRGHWRAMAIELVLNYDGSYREQTMGWYFTAPFYFLLFALVFRAVLGSPPICALLTSFRARIVLPGNELDPVVQELRRRAANHRRGAGVFSATMIIALAFGIPTLVLFETQDTRREALAVKALGDLEQVSSALQNFTLTGHYSKNEAGEHAITVKIEKYGEAIAPTSDELARVPQPDKLIAGVEETFSVPEMTERMARDACESVKDIVSPKDCADSLQNYLEERFALSSPELAESTKMLLDIESNTVNIAKRITTAETAISALAKGDDVNLKTFTRQLLTRIGAVMLLFFAVYVLSGLYRHNTAVAAKYEAAANTLMVAAGRNFVASASTKGADVIAMFLAEYDERAKVKVSVKDLLASLEGLASQGLSAVKRAPTKSSRAQKPANE